MSSSVYYNTLLAISLFSIFCFLIPTKKRLVNSPNIIITILLAVFAALCMGMYPVSVDIYTGTDRNHYALSFLAIQKNLDTEYSISTNDPIFATYGYFLSKYTTVFGFFIITALIYVGNYMLAARKLASRYSYVLFLMVLITFQFFGYGTNTIRAGFAASFIALALAYSDKLWKMAIFLVIGIGCHYSMIVPTGAILLARYFDKTKLYFYLWFAAIIVSAVSGDYFTELFSSLTDDQRTDYLLADENTTYNVGFRIDFILYSCAPLLLGYWYIYKRKFESKIYKQMYNAYIIANIFWILVIRAEFSDRFAYLSWFMMPFLLMYPLLTERIVKGQNRKIALIMFCQLAFTYFMYFR